MHEGPRGVQVANQRATQPEVDGLANGRQPRSTAAGELDTVRPELHGEHSFLTTHDYVYASVLVAHHDIYVSPPGCRRQKHVKAVTRPVGRTPTAARAAARMRARCPDRDSSPPVPRLPLLQQCPWTADRGCPMDVIMTGGRLGEPGQNGCGVQTCSRVPCPRGVKQATDSWSASLSMTDHMEFGPLR